MMVIDGGFSKAYHSGNRNCRIYTGILIRADSTGTARTVHLNAKSHEKGRISNRAPDSKNERKTRPMVRILTKGQGTGDTDQRFKRNC